jgi:prolyl oligopeptidase
MNQPGRPNRRSVLRALVLVATLCLPAAAQVRGDSGGVALHKLFAREWSRSMREDPLRASDLGDDRFNDRWPDRSLAAIAGSHAADEQALVDLAAIHRSALSPEDRVSYDLFQWQYRDALESYRFHEYLFPINQLGGIQTAGDAATQSLRFEKLKDYQDWLTRMRTFGMYMDQTIALLQQGVKERRVLPRVVAERIPSQIAANIVTDPALSPFDAPFGRLPASIDSATATQLRAAARAAIADDVVPAYRRLQAFFNTTYLPNTRTALAVTSLPDGQAYYAYLVRHFTTTDMTPQQVHDMGLKQVAQIHAQMLKVIASTGFKGSIAAFLHYLRTDPRFYYTNPADLLEAYKAQAKTIDPLLVKEFGKLPRIPWGIGVIPADQAPNTYPAYSNPPSADGTRAAMMDVNLYKPETRPKYEIPVLTCHEGRPGHALHLSLAAEMSDLPNFRRFGYFDVYGEGWALYSEVLCGEMGVYTNPYQEFGALSYQMWRAVRLVVDPGMHFYGMTREQAVQMFRDNTALTDQNISTEVDRYIAWPGQALAYMPGELKILELRQRARDRLGAAFDIRAFHDVILQHGTVPLSVLETIVNDWIDGQVAANRR